VIDRASTFADSEVLKSLRQNFVPVALDQAYQRRQEDAEGDFYRRIAQQGRPTSSRNATTQGLYVAAPDGTLLGFTNNRSPDRIRRMLTEALGRYQPASTGRIETGRRDPRYNPQLPAGGLVVRVQARVLDGYDPPRNAMEDAFQTALSRDNLWISPSEHQQLLQQRLPDSLVRRIARFHLVDNTRGEPPMWKATEVQSVDVALDDGVLAGRVQLATADGERAYDVWLRGHLEHDQTGITRFDVVARGTFRGEGRYTRGAPKKPFPLAISFTLADGSDIADEIPPQGSRGWVQGYIDLR